MSGVEQFGGKPRPDQSGQQQERRVTMNNIGKVVLETYGGLQQGSHARQAFDLFTQRVHAKRRFENLLGADASKEAFDNADSAVTAAKADPDLKPQLYAMEENATKWQRALEK